MIGSAPTLRSAAFRGTVALLFAGVLAAAPASGKARRFSFAPYLDPDRPARTLSLDVAVTTGTTIRIRGRDEDRPTKPYRFGWGDGAITERLFPAAHTYAAGDRNRVVTAIATYADRPDTLRTV